MQILIKYHSMRYLRSVYTVCHSSSNFGHSFGIKTDLFKSLTNKSKYSRTRLFRITAYLEVKIWSLFLHETMTTGNKIMWKRGEIAPKEQFLLFSTLFYIYISNFRSQITYSFVKCGCSLFNLLFSSLSQLWYVEVRISRSVSVSPLEFEITRVDCT